MEYVEYLKQKEKFLEEERRRQTESTIFGIVAILCTPILISTFLNPSFWLEDGLSYGKFSFYRGFLASTTISLALAWRHFKKKEDKLSAIILENSRKIYNIEKRNS
ncbi:hypothetical protein [Breoghania sp. JC706]|uniref:hypothetical protein n=1 Tax=Breoghania sp. JC706 TaxID=3117732 RepID=UPI0030081490